MESDKDYFEILKLGTLSREQVLKHELFEEAFKFWKSAAGLEAIKNRKILD